MARYLAILAAIFASALGPAFAVELADPTRPPKPAVADAAVAPNPAQWQLSLVRVSDDDRRAVVNGKLVREGDQVGSARVLRIESSHVVLKQAGRAIRIALAGGPVKSPARARAGADRQPP